MKHLWLIVLLLLGHTSWAEQVAKFEKVAPGLEFRTVKLEKPRPILIHQLRCDPRKVRFQLLLASDGKRGKTSTAFELVQDFSLLAAINSSYFTPDHEILGYARRYQEVINSQIGQGGLFSAYFYWDGGRAGFKRRGESLPSGVPVLFQSGPRLVWDNTEVAGLEKSAQANRSALAIDKKGRVILVAIGGFSRVTLAELPKLLMASEADGGVGAVRALNLDGGSSTQFSLHTDKVKEHLPGFVKVPVFLGVSER